MNLNMFRAVLENRFKTLSGLSIDRERMRSRKSDAMKEEAEIILAQLRAAASRSLERVADTFKRWDADGGGLISRSEFRKAALALFIEGEQRAIDAAFDLLDADGNGSLSIEELSAHLLEHRRKSGRDEMSEKKASSSMATLPNPIKLSSLALSKSDSSLAQFKANLILRTAVSAEQAVEAARQTEHDWRLYETTKHHTQQVLSRRIAERAAEVSAQQEKRRQELLQEEARERLRLLRRLNTFSAERKKRAQEQESLLREQERLMRRALRASERGAITYEARAHRVAVFALRRGARAPPSARPGRRGTCRDREEGAREGIQTSQRGVRGAPIDLCPAARRDAPAGR